ncbi:hypothetical protein ACEQ8H_008062 [Pleosporales sp. CAS-2024a]
MSPRHVQDSFPIPSLQPLAVDFIENRESDLCDSVGDLPCSFDLKRQKFVSKPEPLHGLQDLGKIDLGESNQHLVKTTESFNLAIKALKDKETRDIVIKNFQLGDCNNWEEVLRSMDLVVKQYESRDTKFGKVRSAFRRIGDNAASIQPFVGLLPDGNYKTLCGGLTLILTAMMGHKELREKMASLLEEIPDVVNECERYGEIYPGNNSLRMCITEIHTRLLMALEDMIRWYQQSSASKIVSELSS